MQSGRHLPFWRKVVLPRDAIQGFPVFKASKEGGTYSSWPVALFWNVKASTLFSNLWPVAPEIHHLKRDLLSSYLPLIRFDTNAN